MAFSINSIAFFLVSAFLLPIGNLLCPLKHIVGIFIPVSNIDLTKYSLFSLFQSNLASLSSVSSIDISIKSKPNSLASNNLSFQEIFLSKAFSYMPNKLLIIASNINNNYKKNDLIYFNIILSILFIF